MLNKIKSFLGQKCLFCRKVNNEDSFKAKVNIPGWKDKKKNIFFLLPSWKLGKNTPKNVGRLNVLPAAAVGGNLNMDLELKKSRQFL